MSFLDRLTKRATLATVLALTVLQIAVSRDEPLAVRVAALIAFAAAGAATPSSGTTQSWLMLIAPLAPAAVFRLFGTQGTIADVVWMSGLTASLIRSTSWSGWSFPRTWRLLLGGWALTLCLAWPVVIARESAFDIRTLGDFVTANSWAMISAPHVVVWTAYAIQTQLLGLLWFDWLYGALQTARTRLPRAVDAMWIGVTAASVVAIVQGTFDIGLLNTPFWVAERRATGTMLDANAYAVAAAVAGPIGFFALRRATATPVWALLALVLNWSGVWMSGSRTGLMCAVIGAAGMTIGFMQRPKMAARTFAASTAVVALVAVAGLLARTNGPLARLTGHEGRQQLAEVWDRGGYGTIAVQMAREHPLVGVGAGAYRYLAPDYWRAIANIQLPPDNAQNWWRHQLAELGLSGSILVVLWSVLIAWRVLSASSPENRAEAWTVRGLIAGIAACSLVGMPTQNPVVLLWFFSLVAWLAALAPSVSSEPDMPKALLRAMPTAVIVLAIVHVAGQVLLARGTLSVAERARRFAREYVAGGHGAEQREDGHPYHWTDDKSELILPARSRWLVLSMWAHHPDIAEHPVRVTISSPCSRIFDYELKSPEPVHVGVTLAPGVDTLDAIVTASRTWRPADYGEHDTRRLGVAVLTDFLTDPQPLERTNKVLWGQCPR